MAKKKPPTKSATKVPKPKPEDDPDLGPPAPLVLVVTDGRVDVPLERVHPRLGGLDWFRLDAADGLPAWVDAVYETAFAPLAAAHVPPELVAEPPPRFEVGTLVLVVDMAGLLADPLPGQEVARPHVRLGRIRSLKKPLSAISVTPVDPGAPLTTALGPLVSAQLAT